MSFTAGLGRTDDREPRGSIWNFVTRGIFQIAGVEDGGGEEGGNCNGKGTECKIVVMVDFFSCELCD